MSQMRLFAKPCADWGIIQGLDILSLLLANVALK
jgi:hypothetical protein